MRRKTTSDSLSAIFIAVMILALTIGPWATPKPVKAATTIEVNSLVDGLSNDGTCTLREAVISANKDTSSGSKPGECKAGSGADTIEFKFSTRGSWVIKITKTDNGKEDASASGDLDILGSLTIQGPGADQLTVEAVNAKDRLFHILQSSTNATISGLTLKGGNVSSNGGSVYNNGTLKLVESVITGNAASGEGGGVYNSASGNLTIEGSTIAGNTARGNGGGIAGSGVIDLSNSTLANNRSLKSGGGISSTMIATMNHVTVAYNQAAARGGGVFVAGGTFNLQNTILAANTGAGDCSGSLVSQGYNLIQNQAGCTVTAAAGDISGQPAGLASALASNGGTTPTLALLDGSLAIDAGATGIACLATDQRGVPRPRGQACDIGAYESGLANPPVIIRAFSVQLASGAGGTRVVGRLNSLVNATFTLEFYYSDSCDTNAARTSLGTTTITTNGDGNSLFLADVAGQAPLGAFITAVAYDANGNPSGTSDCVRLGLGNDSWPKALEVTLSGAGIATGSVDDYIDLQGQSRWFKVSVQPGSKLTVALTNLPDNYDLTVYKDIKNAFKTLTTSQDLVQLSAEFAPDSFSPDSFSPDSFSPDSFSPDSFSPDSFSPDSFSPDIFSPDSFSSDLFSPDSFSPDSFSPDSFSPDSFSPDSFSPDSFSTDAYYPDIFSPDSFSSAQTRSLVAVSAFEGTIGEGVRVNTWENTGDYYIRVRGRNGAYNLNTPFHLNIALAAGTCQNVAPVSVPSNTSIPAGFTTLIITNLARLEGTFAEKSALWGRLQDLAMRSEVNGYVLDTDADSRTAAANQQADAYPLCPYAKNLVASSIKEIVDGYWETNPGLDYIVLVGGDEVIPFFRYPDNAGLANERNYVPPVLDNTPSQASLRYGYLLTQDPYGARSGVSVKSNTMWIPELAVGRLVETPDEIMTMLDAYLMTANGTVATPTSAMVTGYDFLTDAALGIQGELSAGLGSSGQVQSLIQPRGFSPEETLNPAGIPWSADDLRTVLLGSRHDLVALAGHFSQATTLAADYKTRFSTIEMLASNTDFTNSIVFSPGCHSGYNTVDAHAVPGVTLQPDWAQAFAQMGATLIAGTGYQYGDTDFIEYGERLYLEFSKQLRAGSGPVAVGEALVRAKQAYLEDTPQLRGIHEKSFQIATLFGLPMLKVDMPAGRGDDTGETPMVNATTLFGSAPGATLGLEYADVTLPFNLAIHTVDLQDTSVITPTTITATYLSGSDGEVTRPGEPTLPVEVFNVSPPAAKSNLVLRGVGFLGGQYNDVQDILPLSGAPTTEVRGVHTPFTSRVFYPIKPWEINYFDALVDPQNGQTQLYITPAHIQTPDPASYLSTLRAYNQMSFRLYYSANIASQTTTVNQQVYTSTPALAAAPAIIQVNDAVGSQAVTFDVRVAGNPAAGIQEVWVTYTDVSAPLPRLWQSIYLTQDAQDTTRWQGSLAVSSAQAQNIRYIVQAANGVGLVSMDTNLGAYYIPGFRSGQTELTSLVFTNPPAGGAYGTQETFTALLSSNGQPLANQPVIFDLGPQYRQGITDASGIVTVKLPLLVSPGVYPVQAYFPGAGIYRPSRGQTDFVVTQQFTLVTLNPNSTSVYPGQDPQMTATLTDINGRRLPERTLIFVVSGPNGDYRKAIITDYAGRAPLGVLPLEHGSYTVEVYFNGVIPLSGGGSITLQDERYSAGFTSGNLVLLNGAPVANPDDFQITANTSLQVPAPGVLGNDSDADGDMLSAVLASGPANGSLALNPDGSFSYTPATNFFGLDSFTYQASDGELLSIPATVSITVDATVCNLAQPSQYFIWPPNNNTLVPVNIVFPSDPNTNYLVTITGIFQDEAVGNGNQAPDGFGIGTSTALVRAERDQSSDGRVYHIYFTAVHPTTGSTCSGVVRVAVYDNQSQPADPSIINTIDGGALYDSTVKAP